METRRKQRQEKLPFNRKKQDQTHFWGEDIIEEVTQIINVPS